MLTPRRQKLIVATFAFPVLLGVTEVAWLGVDVYVRVDFSPWSNRSPFFEVLLLIVGMLTVIRIVANALIVAMLRHAIGSLGWVSILTASATGAFLSTFLETAVTLGAFALASFSCGVMAICFSVAIGVSRVIDRCR